MRFSLALALVLVLAPAHAQVIYGGQSATARPSLPADTIGTDNSWYWDYTTGNIYGPKTDRWPSTPVFNVTTPSLAGLPLCTPGSSIAPVAAGQAFQCSGVVLIAQ